MTDLLQKIIQNIFQIYSLESTTNFEFLKMVHHKPRNGKICFWFDKKYPWLTGKDGLRVTRAEGEVSFFVANGGGVFE